MLTSKYNTIVAMSNLSIKQISIYKYSIPLKEPFVISLGPIYNADNIIIKIETEGGITGWGECSPFMTINGESQTTCFEVGQYLARKLKGRDATDIGGNHSVMDSVIYGNTSIKSAFDIALYDIASINTGLPLYEFLGGKKNKEIISDYTISIGAPDIMAKHALQLVEEGFSIIKVKLSGDPDLDVERMKSIRRVIGDKIDLRIDANQGWELDDAVSALNEMGDLNIQYCEEPIARWDWMRLKTVRENSPIKIMADESCLDVHSARNLINRQSCDMFNLKLGKSSGIFGAVQIIKEAEKAGMYMQIGGFMESRIGMTANAHLALASENIKYFDLDTPMMFSEDIVRGGLQYQAGGKVFLPEDPGLGILIGEAELKRMESITI